MNEWNVQITADGGVWDETEILGDKALCKVRASDATIAAISNAAGFFTIPTRYYRLTDSFSDLTNNERILIQNAMLNLGYTQAEIDAAMGSTLTQWRAKTLDDLLTLATTRRLRARYTLGANDVATIILDGPPQPVKSHRIVAAKVA